MKHTHTYRYLLLSALLLLCLAVLFGCQNITDKPLDSTDGSDSATVDEATESATEEATTEGEPETAGPYDIICNNPDLVCTYTNEEYDTLNQKIDRLYAMLEAAEPARQEEFLTLYNEVDEGDFTNLMGQYIIANVQSSVYTTDKDVADRMETMSQLYNDALQRLIMMYDDIDESPFGTEFYKDWTEEEHALAVRMAKTYTDELTAKKVEHDKLMTEYRAIPDGDHYLRDTAEMYLRAVELNKQIAKLNGYDNYMEYAYELAYERDYSPADVAQMKEYVKQYIVPLLNSLLTKISTLSQKVSQSPADYNSYATYTESELSALGVIPSMGDGSSAVKNSIDAYLKSVNEDMYTQYHDLWDNNRYIVTKNSKVSKSGAFTAYLYNKKYPILYFGPGYHTLSNVIHEYGHYYAMNISQTSDIPMDLAEVQSQGNEWLFTAYLKQRMGTTAYLFMVDYKLFSDLAGIVNCLSVNEFEAYVYSHDIQSADEFDQIMVDVLKELGVYELFNRIYANPTSYWHYVTTDNAAYYISYAMSLIPSITIYADATENYEKAAAAYYSLAKVEDNDTFLGKLQSAGLSSPFEEQTYQEINAMCQALLKRS